MTQISAPWLEAADTQAVFDLLNGQGFALFAVGGCVRNTLLNVPVTDIDLATNAEPEVVMDLAEAEGVRAIPTGLDHGTVTLLVGSTSFEVTTFRDDIETDGRHAVVRFSKDLATDAHRRDFTMNALYADRHGIVTDVVGGLGDLEARWVRFIGDPETRLREDHLRALRYFRFHAWYAASDSGFDPDALAAIAVCLEGIGGLSRERVTSEMLKLLTAPDPGPAVATMAQVGLLHALFERGAPEVVARLIHFEQALDVSVDPLVRLAALAVPDPDGSLRLSRAQSRELRRLQEGIASSDGPAALGYRLGRQMAKQVLALRCAAFEMPVDPQALDDVTRGSEAVFPISATDLMPDLSGAALGEALKRLETAWITSGFRLTRDQLLAQL